MEFAFDIEHERDLDESIMLFDGRHPEGFVNTKKKEIIPPALPLEVLAIICDFVDATTLKNFAMSCKDVFYFAREKDYELCKRASARRWGITPEFKTNNWRSVYWNLRRGRAVWRGLMVQYYKSESAPREPKIAVITTTSEKKIEMYNSAFTVRKKAKEIKLILSFPNLEDSVCKYAAVYGKDNHEVTFSDHIPEIGCNFPWPSQLNGTRKNKNIYVLSFESAKRIGCLYVSLPIPDSFLRETTSDFWDICGTDNLVKFKQKVTKFAYPYRTG